MGFADSDTVTMTEPPKLAVDVIVDRWFVETFHNRPVASDEFNRLSAARDALKAQLAAALTKEH